MAERAEATAAGAFHDAGAFDAVARRTGPRAPTVATLPVCMAVLGALVRPNPGAVAIHDGARFIAAFAQGRPGVHAMGDRAGAVGFLLADPVIQIEGLVADRAMLDRIAGREDLVGALRDLGVDW